MKRLFILLFLFVCLGSSCWAQSLKLDNSKSKINWTGKAALGNYELSGTLAFSKVNMKIQDGQVIATDIVVDMESLNAEIADLKKHLKSKDFFHVKAFPTARFQLITPFDLNKGSIDIAGNLIIKEISHPAKLKIQIDSEGSNTIISGKLSFDRTVYGIQFLSPSFFDNLKDKAIADEIVMDFIMVLLE